MRLPQHIVPHGLRAKASRRNVRTHDLPEALGSADIWTDELVAAAAIPVVDTPFVTVGGGIGSFVMVDYLRNYGYPSENITVLTDLEYPWQTYESRLRHSQISHGGRIRSDSSSMPDNMWGFPSYALTEAWRDKTAAPLWNVLTEPVLSDYWTPRAGMVFTGMQREADRIDYWPTVARGRVEVIRRREGGGYFTVSRLADPAADCAHVAYRSRVVHIALGYPGPNLLPDLVHFRKRGDTDRMVNAYEPHDHVYEALKERPRSVLIRGGGIVASRVLERIIDDRDEFGTGTAIVHLFRTYVEGSHGPNPFNRRRGGDGWAYQGFNYPKGVWGGQLWARFRRLEGDDRRRMYDIIEGTTTARRGPWIRQQARGRREGWYRALAGVVDEIAPSADGKVTASIVSANPDDPGAAVSLTVDYVIDCTGLETEVAAHAVLADLFEHSGAQRNVMDRLDVERTFEVIGTRSGDGRIYATGAATLGGYFPGVDTFLGLQLAAREVADDMARLGMVRRLNSLRSITQWVRWVRGLPPR